MSTEFSPELFPDLHYDFCSVSSTIVPDVTDHGFTGVIRGDATGGAFLDRAAVFGQDRPVLTLTGGQKGGYLQLPDGAANNTEGLCISFFCCIQDTPDPGCVFSFGKDACFYMLSSYAEDDADTITLFPALTTGGRSQEQGFFETIRVKKGRWFHCILSLDAAVPAACRVYIDGIPTAVFQHRRASSQALTDASFCCFGFGAFAEEPLSARFTDICIFHHALDEEQAKNIFSISPEARFSLEEAALAPLFEKPVTEKLPLHTAGLYGCSLSWSSSSPSVISDTGDVTRPCAGSPCAAADLTVSMRWGNSCGRRTFRAEVPALWSDDRIVKEDLDSIRFLFPMHLLSDLTLPEKGPNGSSISWRSSDEAHLSSDGTLCRDHESHPVTLTASAVYGSAACEREFSFCLLPDCTVTPRALCNSIHAEAAPVKTEPRRKAFLPDLSGLDMTDTGILSQNQKRCTDYLTMIDADRMLYNFRRAFGQDTKGAKPLGGWEEPAGLLRGHSTGHLLSALAYGYAYTKNQDLKEKADYMIGELRSLQLLSKGDPASFRTACTPSRAAQSDWSKDPSCWGEGFLSAYSPDQFALLEQFTPYATIWAPYYTLHKLLAGFLDNYRLCKNETALECARGIADWVCRRLSATTREQRSKMWSMYIAGEYGGMNESLASLALITGEDRYMEAASLFDNPKVFDGLADNRDTISGIHANQHIPQMIGALAEYKASGRRECYDIARNFWYLVINHYLYSIGGTGRGEIFKEPDVLAGNIEKDRNCETCAAYNMLKLTAMLYEYEPDRSCYMDYYERALLNQIAASQSPEITPKRHHGVTYMLPIGPGAVREYSNDYNDFTCCHGTGMENHVKYSEQIYHLTEDALYINLYIASRLTSREKQLSLSMDTSFPSEWTRVTVETAGHQTLKLRVPEWCRDSCSVAFRDAVYPAGSCGYITVEADFEPGDTLLVHTPFSVRLCYTPDKLEGKDVASVMYGPMVMTAKSASTDWICLHLPQNPADGFSIDTSEGYPVLRYEDLEFIPMYLAHHMPYHTYFQIMQ